MTTDTPRDEAAPIAADALALIRWVHDTLYEINLNNYDHADVCKLNDASVEVILGLGHILGETYGETPKWWAGRTPQLAAEVLALRAASIPTLEEVEPPCWWIDRGDYREVTQREEVAHRAEADGKEVIAHGAKFRPHPSAPQTDLAAENARLRDALERIIETDHHSHYDGPAPRYVTIARAALRAGVTKDGAP